MGNHWLSWRRLSSLGKLAAAVPASNSGSTWPAPKAVSSSIPTRGLPFCAIQPNNTANTGVVQGVAAKPKASPAPSGASGAGRRRRHSSGSGLAGRRSGSSPSRFNPITSASTATKMGTSPGI